MAVIPKTLPSILGWNLKPWPPKLTPFLNTRSQNLMSPLQLSIDMIQQNCPRLQAPWGTFWFCPFHITIHVSGFYYLLFAFQNWGLFYHFVVSAQPHSALSSQNKLSWMLFYLFFVSAFGVNKEPPAPWGSGWPVCMYIAAGRRPALVLRQKPQMLQNRVEWDFCFVLLACFWL